MQSLWSAQRIVNKGTTEIKPRARRSNSYKIQMNRLGFADGRDTDERSEIVTVQSLDNIHRVLHDRGLRNRGHFRCSYAIYVPDGDRALVSESVQNPSRIVHADLRDAFLLGQSGCDKRRDEKRKRSFRVIDLFTTFSEPTALGLVVNFIKRTVLSSQKYTTSVCVCDGGYPDAVRRNCENRLGHELNLVGGCSVFVLSECYS